MQENEIVEIPYEGKIGAITVKAVGFSRDGEIAIDFWIPKSELDRVYLSDQDWETDCEKLERGAEVVGFRIPYWMAVDKSLDFEEV